MSPRPLAVALIAVATLGFPLPYLFHNWWRYLPETALLLLTCRVAFGPHWRERTGLRNDLAVAPVAFAVVTAAALVLVPKLTKSLGFVAAPGTHYFLRPVFAAFHALNEELVFRALPLLALRWSREHPRLASFAASVAFVAAHAAFYPLAFGGRLGAAALLSLFFLGIGLNAWCVARRSIGIPWAIHAGVNTALFGLHDYTTLAGKPVTQPQFFDAALGHPMLLGATALLAVSGLLAFRVSVRQ